MVERPRVDVVVTHYEDPRRLRWVLEALAAQTYPARLVSIVVADDGSAREPTVPAGVTLVSQPDEGFRAAAARNLGARRGDAPYVLFLDGDTVPEPGFVEAMVAALGAADGPHGALVVGRRRHADLTAFAESRPEASAVGRWVSEPAMRAERFLLQDPQWLVQGYERTADLADAGPDDWRFVISAVLGMSRSAVDRLGGFDETLVGYGGEDWDLAYRVWNTGGALRHAPEAIAWHDGPDAGDRAELAQLKQGEQLALAARIPQPLVRGSHARWAVPRVVVRLWVGDVPAGVAYAVVESWLALGDVAVFGFDAEPLGLTDDRIRTSAPSEDHLDRAEYVVEVDGPVHLVDPAGLRQACDAAPRTAPGVRAARTRDRRGGTPETALADGIVRLVPTGEPLDLESWGRRWWR